MRWVLWSFVLYFVAGACWLPIVWIQIKMRAMADSVAQTTGELPEQYWRYFGWWVTLGVPAFIALVIVFWLMVAKPA